MKHAIYGPSKSERWLNCPGSVERCRNIPPNPVSDAAYIGTVLHTWCSDILTNKQRLKLLPAPGEEVPYEDTDGSFVVEQEHINAVATYTRTVRRDFRASPKGSILLVEKTMSSGLDDYFGTGDAVILRPAVTHSIYDFKSGVQNLHHAETSTQLMCYADLASSFYRESTDRAQDRWEKVIIQPRAYDPEYWETRHTVSAKDIKLFRRSVTRARRSNHIHPGKWCKWCSAATPAHCPEFIDYGSKHIIGEFEDLTDPGLMTDDQVIAVVKHQKDILAWLDAVIKYAEHKLVDGTSEPISLALKQVEGRSIRHWVNPMEVTKQFPEATVTETKLLSPAQLEKAIGKKRVPEDLWDKPPGKPKLVTIDDKRPAIQASPLEFDIED